MSRHGRSPVIALKGIECMKHTRQQLPIHPLAIFPSWGVKTLCALALYINITMGMLLRTSVFLWISVGFLSLPEKSEACTGNYSLARCEFVFRNVCFEFVGGSKTWFQARGSCEKRGGELLKVMNSPIKMFLKNITREGNTGNFSWWLGEGSFLEALWLKVIQYFKEYTLEKCINTNTTKLSEI
uniref:C-type lectin domain-containing protein n=1 Tax=Sander lucioperca TaxID=283035 RepID=A0A8C9XYF1_SANLU